MTLPERWFHGSPYCCFETMRQYRGDIMFMSDSRAVAVEYLRKLIGSGELEGARVEPTLYELELVVDSNKIFDLRKPDHAALWPDLAKLSRARYGEDGFSRKDVIRVPRAPGSRIEGELPAFGVAVTLLPMLDDLKFAGALLGEGSQGGSLVVIHPQKNVRLVQKWTAT